MNYTDLYSEVLVAGVTDTKGRDVAFEFSVWQYDDGDIYANVQKGYMKDGDFVKFGVSQSGKQYRTEKDAIVNARSIAKSRIILLRAAA